ncbi:MAG: GNAT family N-acetyltransferase [Nitriliruptoraceae bacterium]
MPALRLIDVDDAGKARRAIEFLDRCATDWWPAGSPEPLPAVDEAEGRRLSTLMAGSAVGAQWKAWVALADGDDQIAGYLGARRSPGPDSSLDVELAVERTGDRSGRVVTALLGRLRSWLGDEAGSGAAAVGIWVRQVDDVLDSVMRDTGGLVDRHLGVMALTVAASPGNWDDQATEDPASIVIRPSDDSEDDIAAVVAVLAAAYDGTAEAGWDRTRFDQHAAAEWFDPRDLLVAVRIGDRDGDRGGNGQVVGVHWTKRRSATVGEVYNLAVDPEVAGRGLGRRLLAAGIGRLQHRGCDAVMLWVDLSNRPAVRLYEDAGFILVATDVRYVLPHAGTAR